MHYKALGLSQCCVGVLLEGETVFLKTNRD